MAGNGRRPFEAVLLALALLASAQVAKASEEPPPSGPLAPDGPAVSPPFEGVVPDEFDMPPPDAWDGDAFTWHPPTDHNHHSYPPDAPLSPPEHPFEPESPTMPPRSPHNPQWPKDHQEPLAHPIAPSPPDMPAEPRLPLRLVGGATSAEGVVQVYNEATDEWGSFCVPVERLKGIPGRDQDVAKMICRDLGLPWHSAKLVHPFEFNSADIFPTSWKAMVATTYVEQEMCPNAAEARSVFDCDGVRKFVAQPRINCNTAGRVMTGRQKRNYLPAAVSCREVGPREGPPPRSPPLPPLAKIGPSVNYTTRIVHPVTGTELGPDGRRVTRGRLEVLLPTPGGDEPYACRAAGLPWRGALFTTSRYAPRLAPKSIPMHWYFVEHCRLDPTGLACAVTAGAMEVSSLLQRARLTDGAAELLHLDPHLRTRLRASLEACDASQKGHYLDAVAVCYDGQSPMPPDVELHTPAPPPSPPLAIQSDVLLKADEVYDGVYMVQLGVRPNATAEHVWGTVCDDDMYRSQPPGLETSAAAAVCHQLTNGVKPYGVWWYVSPENLYTTLPSLDERQAVPWVATALDCTNVPVSPESPPVWTAVGEYDAFFAGSAPNVTACRVVVPKPVGKEQPLECASGAWAHRLLACNTVDAVPPRYIVAARLAGGTDRSCGRLEVLLPNHGTKGWGTVCAPDFTLEQAQAICRDLGYGWTNATLLPSAAVARADDAALPIALEAVVCSNARYPLFWMGDAAPYEARSRLSFVRDCQQRADYNTVLPLCDHMTDVVISCGGDSPPPPRLSPAPSPAYGAYGAYGSPPPPAYGHYGGYPGDAPSYPPHDHGDYPSPPLYGGSRRALRR